MSHFTRVKTKINDLVRLKQVLKELDYDFLEAGNNSSLVIKGWDKLTQNVQLEIKTGCSYSVGIILNENNFEFVADWWGLETYTGITQEDFINKITRKYAYDTVMDKIKEKGYSVVTEEIDDKQNIRILLRKWE